MSAPRSTILHLIDQGHLPPEHAEQAMEVAGVFPDAYAWRRFVGHLLLWLGILATVLGVVFFVAFNWDLLDKFGKFALIQTLLILSLLPLLWHDRSTLIGKLSLSGASILTGALLALFGQTYQTGADTWQLFATWALLIVPWVWVGRFEVLWLVWIGIINVALVLYYSLFKLPFGLFFIDEIGLALVMLILNGAVTILWEYALHHHSLRARNGVRILAVATGIAATFIGIWATFDRHDGGGIWWFIWLAWLGLHCGFYRQILRDLFMLTGGCLSAIIILMVFASKHLIRNHFEAGGFFIMAFILLLAGSSATIWLRHTAQKWEADHE
jgi:uncharacterized membrane protein